MNEWFGLNGAPIFVEMGADTLRAVRGAATLELELGRSGDGKLTSACRELVVAGLAKFADRKSWQPRIRCYCAVAANGLVLRRFKLPPASSGDRQRLLRLQLESTFTLPPEALAWGWQLLPADPKSPAGPAQPEALVAVVRKEVLADYQAVFTAAGLNPVFTPAALIRHVPGPAPAGPYAVLEVGRASSELACFTAGVVESVRVIPWGMTKGGAIPGAAELDLGTDSPRRKLFFSCDPAQRAAVAARLREHGGPDWEPLPVPPGSSAAIVGLSQSNAAMGGMLRLEPQTRSAASRFDFSGAETKMWLRRAAVLLALLLVLPYVEAVLLRPLIAKQFSRTRVKKDQLVGVVDRELHFLQYLKQNQPPYLDALYLLAKAAPPGTSLNPISLNRKGEIALQATFQNAQQVMDFRARLNDNGSFTNVVVQEQVPTPDRQHVTARLTARWNLAAIANRPKALTEAPETQTSPTSRAVPPAGAAMPATPAKP